MCESPPDPFLDQPSLFSDQPLSLDPTIADSSLMTQCKALLCHADLPHHSYGDYQALVSQAGSIYLQLLRDYLAYVPDQEVSDRTIAVGRLMIEIQELLR